MKIVLSKAQKLSDNHPHFLIVAILFWLSLEYVILGKYSLFVAGDNISVIPYYLAFYSNNIPVSNWTPFPTAGTDLAATGYFTILYKAIFFIFPSWAACQILIAGPIFAGVLGIYGLCKKTLKLDNGPSIFAGFSYGVLYFNELFFLTSMPGYLPLTILALSYLLDDTTNLKLWAFVIFSGFLISQSSFMSRLLPWPLAAYFLWFFFVEYRRKLSQWAIIAIFSIGIIGARWPDIVNLLTYIDLAEISKARSTEAVEMPFTTILSSIKGNLAKDNFIPLIFISGFIMSWSYINRRVYNGLFLALLGLFSILIFGSLAKVILVHHLPFLNGYNFTHVMQTFGFFALTIGGAFLQSIKNIPLNDPNIKFLKIKILVKYLPIFILFLILIASFDKKVNFYKAWVTWGNLYQNTKNPLFLDLAQTIQKSGPARVLSFHMHGNMLNAYGIETLAGYHTLLSTRYAQLWSKMTEKWRQLPYWKDSFGNQDFSALTSILPATKAGRGDMKVTRDSSWKIGDFLNLNLLSLFNARYVASKDKLTDKSLVLLKGPKQSWNSLSQIEKVKINLKGNFTAQQHMFLYENPLVFPRAFSVKKIKILNSDKQVLEALGNASLENLKNIAFMSAQSVPLSFPKSVALSRVAFSIEKYESDNLEINLKRSSQPSFLVITNSFSPFWQCFIDGAESQIIPTNHAFWGVLVPPKSKKLIFRYKPPYQF